MIGLKHRLNFVALSIALLLNQSARIRAQEPRIEGPLIIPPPNARKRILQARANGSLKPFAPKGTSIKQAVFTHPMPEAFLVFPASQDSLVMRVELPRAAVKPLKRCWIAELKYHYQQAFELQNRRTRIQSALALSTENGWVLSKLENIFIDTPSGKRKMTSVEAADLVGFMAQSAQEVIKQAKEASKHPPVAKREKENWSERFPIESKWLEQIGEEKRTWRGFVGRYDTFPSNSSILRQIHAPPPEWDPAAELRPVSSTIENLAVRR